MINFDSYTVRHGRKKGFVYTGCAAVKREGKMAEVNLMVEHTHTHGYKFSG